MDLFETPKIEFIEINDCDILSPINYCSHITLCSADFKYIFTENLLHFCICHGVLAKTCHAGYSRT